MAKFEDNRVMPLGHHALIKTSPRKWSRNGTEKIEKKRDLLSFNYANVKADKLSGSSPSAKSVIFTMQQRNVQFFVTPCALILVIIFSKWAFFDSNDLFCAFLLEKKVAILS